MGNPNCVRYCDYDGSCAAGIEIDRLKAELNAVCFAKSKSDDTLRSEVERLRALLHQCAIVIRKVHEEDNFYLPDEICGNSWDEQLAFIDRIEDAAGRGEG